LNAVEGMRVARGGGLLFLTNLVAIMFTAMIVFLLLHIDTDKVKKKVEEWRKQDKETTWFRSIFGRVPISDKVRAIGKLPGRLLMIIIPILALLIPLSQSFSQLRSEIAREQQENRVRQAATELWSQNFAKLPDGQPRSYIDRISVAEQDNRLTLNLLIFTSKPCSNAEKNEYTRLVAARLDRLPEALGLQLVEIPTTSGELVAKATEQKRIEAPPEPPPTVAQLQMRFLQGVESAIKTLRLPQPAQLLNYRVITSATQPLNLVMSYLSDRDIDADAQSLLADDIKARLGHQTATVSFERIPVSSGQILFGRNQAMAADASLLDLAGQVLRQQPALTIEIIGNAEKGEREGMANERAQAVADYLTSSSRGLPYFKVAGCGK
jgi:outer membrane protein OmpA-like peptidoglycan-associated protein